MSHKATSWAIEQRDLKPGPWVVLFQLADRVNKDTFRCDPDQFMIAADCNMGRSTINRHLKTLEELGKIRRIQRFDTAKNKPLNTFYILGLDFDKTLDVEFSVSQNETRENDHSVSRFERDPCPDFDANRVPIRDTNLVREPVSKPEKEETNVSSKKTGTRLPENWELPKDWGDWAIGRGWSEQIVRLESEKFKNYWLSLSGRQAIKLNWERTWQNWMLNSRQPMNSTNPGDRADASSSTDKLRSIVTAGARGTSDKDWG